MDKLKWYSMPIAIVAYSMIVVTGFVWLWNYIADTQVSQFWYIIAGIAGIYLVLAFLLSLINLHWELTVLLQVALVLGPLLYFINNNEPYRPPVFVFLVNSGYTGPLEITFKESSETQVKKRTDTLYFPFDVEGKLQLQEDYRMVKAAMEKNCYYLYTDRSRELIPYISKQQSIPADTLKKVLVSRPSETKGAKMQVLKYQVEKAGRVKW
ncbi:MAG: hypothetical protein MUC87_21795 [Bacteroidia bacterium]|jgi:hypothetical protein|nr:hypothetical protein [Bacteroidia bacterium]